MQSKNKKGKKDRGVQRGMFVKQLANPVEKDLCTADPTLLHLHQMDNV